MDPDERDEIERSIRDALAQADHARAATALLRGYGPEILGYLMAATGREQEAADVFSDFCEHLWRGLPGFRGEASARTWSYRVAYHALARAGRGGARRRKRFVAMSEVPEIEAIVAQVRTQTAAHLRTTVKQEVLELRAQLEEQDRTLLVLRIDRRLPWEEIARIVDEDEPTPESVKRHAAALRKRFERVKTRLRELAKGLVTDS
ncbi:MAG: sigma-70 family RNA polymerase sigma factor [Nannocystaceae bacterium]